MGSLRYSRAFTSLATPDRVNPVGRLKERLLRQTMLLVCLSAISSLAAARTESSMWKAVAVPRLFSFTPALVKSAGATAYGDSSDSMSGSQSVLSTAAVHDHRMLPSCQTNAGNSYAASDIQGVAGPNQQNLTTQGFLIRY